MRGSIFRSLRGVRAGKLELELELELFSEKSVVESVELPRHVARQFERSRKICFFRRFCKADARFSVGLV